MKLSNHSKKHIDDLAERLGSFDAAACWKAKRLTVELHKPLAAAMLRDPRQRYRDERSETWEHDSNFREDCYCDGCKSGIDPCVNGCHFGCVPNCKYYPEAGLQMSDGRIACKGTAEYEHLLQEWKDYCRLQSR
jgi:hypothetical protein